MSLRILACAGIAFACTLLLPVGLASSAPAVLACAVVAMSILRRADIPSSSMAMQFRILAITSFGFLFAGAVFGWGEWEESIPLLGGAAAAIVVLPLFPSRSQKSRMARTWNPEEAERAAWPIPHRGWWWAHKLCIGAVGSVLLKVIPEKGWTFSIALFIATALYMHPLDKLARRRTKAMAGLPVTALLFTDPPP